MRQINIMMFKKNLSFFFLEIVNFKKSLNEYLSIKTNLSWDNYMNCKGRSEDFFFVSPPCHKNNNHDEKPH